MPANRLALEKSPYLLQHAHNPVDWFPWGEEAFSRARAEDKPIFLSIGYSTCHWCHVMERESFENPEIAELMNQWFVCIKMDREERPDIDRIYMTYVQASTGGGGWPMSVWLTPDLKPFVGGTYFPPDDRYGRPGFPAVLKRIAQAWTSQRAQILESSENIMDHLRSQANRPPSGSGHVEPALPEGAFNHFRRSFDARLGGFGNAPKFPRPSVFNFLLRYWKRTGNPEALDMVAATLTAMDSGGMNDQLGGGFHRYSVDAQWFVPHFEKMLYDQAQLVVSYVETFQITGDPRFSMAARRTLDYVLRDMTAPEGAFWSAEDADSAADAAHPHEKGEGAFYLWSWAQLVEILGEQRAAWVAYRYGAQPEGNVDEDPHQEFTGRNIFFAAHTIGDTAREFAQEPGAMATALGECDALLLGARHRRPRPHLDDKILSGWNGMMISAFVRAGAVLGDSRYIAAAAGAADFLLSAMVQEDGKLLRRYRAAEAAIPGMLEDYTLVAAALLDLYEVTAQYQYLSRAIALTEWQIALFEDTQSGGFFASNMEDATRLVRMKEDYDGAEPSGNSIALGNLLRLHRMTGNSRYEESARRLLAALRPQLEASSYALPQLLAACELDLAPHRQVAIAIADAGDLPPAMAEVLWRKFDPNRVVLYADSQTALLQPALAAMTSQGAACAVYVCENFTCQSPVTTAQDLARLLE